MIVSNKGSVKKQKKKKINSVIQRETEREKFRSSTTFMNFSLCCEIKTTKGNCERDTRGNFETPKIINILN